jgi:hypothetical protein
MGGSPIRPLPDWVFHISAELDWFGDAMSGTD